MLTEITFKKDDRCFKKGTRLTFRPGVNPLVGDQGTGKSTILSLTRALAIKKDPESSISVKITGPTRINAFDFERENPRTKAQIDDIGGMFQIQSHFMSHGETIMVLIEDLEHIPFKEPTLLLLDEPDTGLSPRSAHRLLAILNGLNDKAQVIVALHNPIVIAGCSEVLSLEHMGWVTSEKYLADQADPKIKAPWRKAKQPARRKRLPGQHPR